MENKKDDKLKNDGQFQLIRILLILIAIIAIVGGVVQIAETFIKAETSKPAKVCMIVCANDSTSVTHVLDSIERSNLHKDKLPRE